MSFMSRAWLYIIRKKDKSILLFVILLVNNFVSDPIPSLKGLIIIAVCVPFYFIFRKINGGVEYDTDKIDN